MPNIKEMQLLKLSLYYTLYLLKQRKMVYILALILVVSFLIIPTEQASYITFYIDKTTAVPNQYWIGHLGAVFSSLSIALVLLYVILGEREKEIKLRWYYYEELSPINPRYLFVYKVLGLYLFALFLLACLSIALILVNIHQVYLAYYLVPLCYYALPFLWIVSVLCYLIEYYLPYQGLKIGIYGVLILVLMINDQAFSNPFGVHELSLHLGQRLNNYDYAFGVLQKSKNIEYITINEVLKPLFLVDKLVWVLGALLVVLLSSFVKIKRRLDSVAQEKPQLGELTFGVVPFGNFKFTDGGISWGTSIFSLLKKDSYLLGHSFSKMSLFFIGLFWVISFFVSSTGYGFALPLLFLFCLSVNEHYLGKLYYYNLSYLERLSPFSTWAQWLSKGCILLCFYGILLLPYLVKNQDISYSSILLSMSALVVVQILLVRYTKSSILADILYIILFTSYISGYPVFNLFYL